MNPDTEPMCKGAVFKVNAAYIKKIAGAEGLGNVTDRVGKKFPYFNVDGIKDRDWIPLEMRVEFLEACKSELGWDDKRIFQMGSDAAQRSSIIMSFISYFLTVNKALHYAPDMWSKNYNTGYIEVLENEKGHGKLALLDFNHAPILCTYLAGFFHGVGAVVSKATEVNVTEETCVHKGADKCVFSFTWDD